MTLIDFLNIVQHPFLRPRLCYGTIQIVLFLLAHICMHIRTHTHTHLHAYTHSDIYTYTHAYKAAYIISRAQSFPRRNLTNSAVNWVNSAAHRGNTDEIPRLD